MYSFHSRTLATSMALSSIVPHFEPPSITSFDQDGQRRRILPEVLSQKISYSKSSKVFAVSDVHTDYSENLDWIRCLCSENFQRDTLILAGDVSDDLQTFAATMALLRKKFAAVFFVPGNHDLWCRGKGYGNMNSLDKLDLLEDICRSNGIDTMPRRVNGVWIVPVFSWYHQSFDKELDITGYSIPSLEKACVDYHACKWPAELKAPDTAIASYFDNLNPDYPSELQQHSGEQIITFSHFVPRPELCPEKRMLFYPNLPKVIGSDFLETRLRSIHGSKGSPTACHVFGHTHFCWDATIDGIRYLQAPLAYPRERRRRVNGGENWLPMCIFDSDAGGLAAGPVPCYWSDYYRHNQRDPSNVMLAPWVASLYHSKKPS